MKNIFLGIIALALAVPAAAAKDYAFDVNSKFVNIAFESEMDIEDIVGTSNSITGHFSWGEQKSSFRLEVPVASLKTGIEMRDEHLRSEMWLDAGKHPKIIFEGKEVISKGNNKYQVKGHFWLKGKKVPLTTVVDIRRIPSSRAKSVGMGDAEWLRIRGEFKVKLSEHGVKIPDMAAAKVSDVWTVKLSLFAKEK